MNRFLAWVFRSALMMAILHGSCSMGDEDPLARGAQGGDKGGFSLSAVTPAVGPTSGGTPLNFDGAGFAEGATVSIAGTPVAQVWVESATRLTAILPAHPGAFGKVPVVVRNPDGQTVTRDDLFGYQASQFAFPDRLVDVPGAGAVATGDFNGDQKLDLVIAGTLINKVSVLLGNGHGGFSEPVSYPTGAVPSPIVYETYLDASAIVVGDWNGDQALDLAVTTYPNSGVSMLFGDGLGRFGAAVSITTSGFPRAVTVADVDSDQKLDLVFVNQSAKSVGVLLGNGRGGFTAAAGVGGFTSPSSLAVGDWNRDGKLDVVVGSSANVGVSICLGDGQGGFGAPATFPAGTEIRELIAGDWNGDQKLDLAVAPISTNDVRWLLGDGQGGFGGPTLILSLPTAGGFARRLFSGDWNGDQALDLVVASVGLNTPGAVMLGNGMGSFIQSSAFNTGWGAAGVVTGDFNGDKKPDLAFILDNPSGLYVLFADGSGHFTASSAIAAGTTPMGVAVGDWNADQRPDVAVANNGSNDVSVFLNDGMGSLGPATSFPVGVAPVAIAAGDFNGDRFPDLAVTNGGGNSVSVLLGDGYGRFGPAPDIALGGTPQGIVVGDWNGDHHLDICVALVATKSIAVLLGNGKGSFGIGPPSSFWPAPSSSLAAGDFNSDGRLDLAAGELTNAHVVGAASVAIGNGMGGFGVPAGVGTGVYGQQIATGDFNRDGKLDIVAGGVVANYVDGSVVVQTVLADGRGLFTNGSIIPASTGFSYLRSVAVAVVDVDGDQKLDVVHVSSTNLISIFLGNGTGGLSAAKHFVGGSAPSAIGVGDFNQDGKPDLVVANAGSNDIALLWNVSQ